MNTPDPTKWTLNSRFAAFSCISVHLAMFRYYTELGAKWVDLCNQCTSLCHEVALEFFATNAPDPPHWTLNSCFGAFRSVWVLLSMFRYNKKLGAKWVELVQSMHKFVP